MKYKLIMIFKDGLETSAECDDLELLKQYKNSLALKREQIKKTDILETLSAATDTSEALLQGGDVDQTASVLDSVNSSSTSGFWSKLINVPVNGVKSLVHMFYNF